MFGVKPIQVRLDWLCGHPCSIESLCHVIYDTKCAEISALYRIYLSVQLFLLGGGCGGTTMVVFCECAELPACVRLALFGHPCLRWPWYLSSCVGMKSSCLHNGESLYMCRHGDWSLTCEYWQQLLLSDSISGPGPRGNTGSDPLVCYNTKFF